jgi:hypothetical protein
MLPTAKWWQPLNGGGCLRRYMRREGAIGAGGMSGGAERLCHRELGVSLFCVLAVGKVIEPGTRSQPMKSRGMNVRD